MAGGLTQDFAGSIEPDDPDWLRASEAIHRAYYEAGGPIVLDELTKQLGRGIGSNGRAMKARIQPVLDDGADGPVMEPHYSASRVITLADWAATDRGLKLFWHAGTGHKSHRKARKIGKKAPPFGAILAWHAAGEVPHCPVRDVRLCAARVANVKNRLKPVWEQLRRGMPAPAFTAQAKVIPWQPTAPTPAARPTPAVAATATSLPSKFRATGRTDFENFVFGAGGTQSDAQRLLDAGYSTGFRRLPRYRPPGGGPKGGQAAAPPKSTLPMAPQTATLPPTLRRPAAVAKGARPAIVAQGTKPAPGEVIPPRPAAAARPRVTQEQVERSLGMHFARAPLDKTDVTVLIDVRKLNRPLSAMAGHGSSNPTDEGYARAKAFMAQARAEAITIHQPRITIDSRGNPVIEDGRHRFAVLRDEGVQFLPVSVPPRQAKLFERQFGPGG